MSLAYLRQDVEEVTLEMKNETWEKVEAFRAFAESRGFENLDDGKVVEALLKGFFGGDWAVLEEFEAAIESE